MATQLQLRRGTTSQVAAFTGANGEVVVDTEKKTLFVNDGSTAGGLEIARADFSNISPSATLTIGTLNTTNLDLTNLEVTNIKAKDGTAAGSIADSTGVVTIASAVLTTADINAGTFDGVVGGTTPAAGSFTTLSASTSLTVDDDVSVQGAAPTFQLYDTTVTNNIMKFEYDETFLVDIDPNNVRGNSSFQVDIDGTSAFLIDSSRNVGIGVSTVSTNTKLHVKAGTNINFEVENSSSTLRLSALNDARSANVPMQFASSAFNFITGNVGIGPAPQSTYTGASYPAIELGSGMLMGGPDNASVAVLSNTYLAADGNWKRKTTAAAANYTQNAGKHYFYHAASDSNDSTITFSELLRIDSSGLKATGNVDISGALLVGTDVAYDKFAVLRTSTTQTAGMTLLNDQSGGYGSGITWESKRSDTGSIQTAGRLSIQGENSWASDGTASSAFYVHLRSGNSLEERFKVNHYGLIVSLGTYNNGTSFASNMYVHTNGVLYRSTSSRRYKNTIEDAKHGLSDLLKLRSVTYKGNDDAAGDTVFGGLIAEEVHDAGLTEFVQYNDDNEPDALAYGNMVSLCVKAIQEQQTQIEALKSEVAALKGG